VGVVADEGTSRYTEMYNQNIFGYVQCKVFYLFVLLCCPVLTPQIMGATVVDPPTIKASVQVPRVGWAIVKETKSNLERKIYFAIKFHHYTEYIYS
jgi:hypothetical protein